VPRAGLLAGLSLVLAAVIYGPMLRPGYPLRYDLVSVPRPVLGDDALGLGDRLPRAIPLDAATAVLARILPDAWLTQLLALLALTLAGWGVAVLTPAPLPGRLLALLVAEWNPFVLEQLAIGHIPHLFAYGALPWVAVFGRQLGRGSGPGRAGNRHGGSSATRHQGVEPGRHRGPGPRWRQSRILDADEPDRGGAPRSRWTVLRAWGGLTAAAGFGSLTPGGGVLCAVVTLCAIAAGAIAGGTAGAGRWWRVAAGVGTVGVVLQLPWLVAALEAPGLAVPKGAAGSGIAAFALRSETGWGRLVDAAGLAGMWNGSALPISRTTVLARVSTVLLLGLAAAGLPAVRRLWRAGCRPELLAGAVAGLIGYLVAVLPVLPGGRWVLQTLIDAVPGAGLLRDGHRWLALPAVLIAVLSGLGVTELAGWAAAIGSGRQEPAAGAERELTSSSISQEQVVEPALPTSSISREQGAGPELTSSSISWRIAVALFAGLLVVASIPDLAGGLDGRLRARHYPGQWAQARAVLDRSDDQARVLVLPWQPFRIFDWSGPDPVLDPAPRLLPRQSIVSDALTVSGRRLPDEGPGARTITADLASGGLSDARLRSLAIGWVLVEHGTPGSVPELPAGWTTAFQSPELTLLRAPGPLPAAPRPTTVRAVTVVGSQLLAGGVLLLGLLSLLTSQFRLRRSRATRPRLTLRDR
jgi:hypothetical protein